MVAGKSGMCGIGSAVVNVGKVSVDKSSIGVGGGAGVSSNPSDSGFELLVGTIGYG